MLVRLLSPGREKLSARSVKCVFLGYSRSQKGYLCYSPDLDRFFISPDVTFFESAAFFTPAQSPQDSITEVLPIPHFESISSMPQSRPLQTYHRRRMHLQDVAPPISTPADLPDSPPVSSALPPSAPPSIVSGEEVHHPLC